MKMAVAHFQCAAWAFHSLPDIYPQVLLRYFHQLNIAAFFWYLVKSDLSSSRYFLQGTRRNTAMFNFESKIHFNITRKFFFFKCLVKRGWISTVDPLCSLTAVLNLISGSCRILRLILVTPFLHEIKFF